MTSSHLVVTALSVATLLSAGCSSSSSTPTPGSPPAGEQPAPSGPLPASGPQSSAVEAAETPAGPSGIAASLFEALGAAASGSLPDGVRADGDCPILYPPPDEEIAAQAAATVPLKRGLTLSNLWSTIESPDDIECLSHIEEIDAEAFRVSFTCLNAPRVTSIRRTCRTDLRRARVFQTMLGSSVPETLVGATTYNLSRDAFVELKRTGTTRHRYIEARFKDRGTAVDVNLEGTLQLEGTGTVKIIVNDAPVDLPVLRVSGSLSGVNGDKPVKTRVMAAVLDDERFPLMLDYRFPDLGEHTFSVRYTRISFPTERAIEKRLAEEKSVDVYGIYFDFASDQIRKESDPVLNEIGDALKRNGDWTLSIGGHTDNIGSDAANLDLSRRRSQAVRAALVERFGIDAGRLTAAGYGEGAPKDTNDTPEGRARNRRVELVRR